MPVEFIGLLSTQESSESVAPRDASVQPDYLRDLAIAHEEADFDRALIGYHSTIADGFLVGQFAAGVTKRLSPLVAHRPGFMAPTLAARKFATLDRLSGGRAAVNIISGGDDTEQQRDGDYVEHDDRYARTAEYIEIMRRIWAAPGPVDHEGTYYRFRENYSGVKPVNGTIPVYFSGSSDAAIEVGARLADVYMLWAESLEGTRDQIARIRASALRQGRTAPLTFSLSVRPILAPTEAQAWQRAADILAAAKALRGSGKVPFFGRRGDAPPKNIGSLRLLDTVAHGKVVDKRLWTEIAALTGAAGNSTALVGTPEQVAEALIDYWDLGISTLLIRGFDPLADAVDYGRHLIPLVRREVAVRDGGIPTVQAEAAA